MNSTTEMRKCTKCKQTILLEGFDINKKGELFKTWNNCRNYNKTYKESHKEQLKGQSKIYHEAHKEEIKERKKENQIRR